MSLLETWFRRKATIVSVLLILLVLAAVSLRSLQFGPSRAVGAAVFSVSIDYFGVDAEEIERQVTIPLEDAIAGLSGMQRLRSTSEYGKSVVEVTLSPSTAPDAFFLALRDAVNTLHATLPKAVQRPEIRSAANDQRPFFIATVSMPGASLDETRDFVDISVKPALERLDGVGELEVGGGSQREVHVVVDQARASAARLSFDALAAAIQAQSLSRPIGRLRTDRTNIPVILNGRLETLRQLADLSLGLGDGGFIRLGGIAEILYAGREQDTISRIDQEQRVTLSLKSSGTANIVALSGAVRRRITELSSPRASFEVMYDLGADIAASINDVLRSLAASMAIVAFFVGVVLRPPRNAILLAAFLPLVVLAAAAILSALGMSVDNNILAGIGVGIGMIADPAIIVLSALVAPAGRDPAASTGQAIRELLSPLIASTAAILIVLVPLLSMGRSVSGLSEVSYALALMLIISLSLAVFILPAFAARRGRTPDSSAKPGSRYSLIHPRARRLLARRVRRLLDGIVLWAGAHSLAILGGTAVVCGLGIFAAFRMDLVLSPAPDPRSIFAHIEFRSGTTIEAIDRRTTELARAIRGMPGVQHVETIARRESSQLAVTTGGRASDAAAVRAALSRQGLAMTDAFVYLPEGAGSPEQALEVSLVGPDNAALRAAARHAAEVLQRAPWVSQVVLNFKEGPPAYELVVDHDLVSSHGLSTAAVASTLRWSMYGPVALKWMEPDSREIDLRIRSPADQRADLSSILRTVILCPDGKAVPVSGLGTFQEAQPPSRIFRADRQRAVSLTVHSGLRDTRAVLRNLESLLASIPLPAGYALRTDNLIDDRLRQFQTLASLLLGALVLVYITLAAQMESLSSPLMVMSIVPVSLSIPLAFLWVIRAGISVPVIVALIIMSGIIVNNAILVTDRTLARCAARKCWTAGEVLRSLRYAVRRRTRALLLTSTTTILGVTPFLFGAASGSELLRSLAIVVLWGTVASVAATFLVLPAVVAAAPVFARRFPPARS
jgi:multidrug efflux pump subunit AcrB